MTSIDEIMTAALTLVDQRLMATHSRATREDVREAETEMRDMIAAALADARREGATGMREAAAKTCREARPIGGRAWSAEQASCFEALTHVADYVDALPLPTGERQAVLLTDEIKQACSDIAAEVAKNCGSVPQLTFPHIYLSVTTLLEKARVCRG